MKSLKPTLLALLLGLLALPSCALAAPPQRSESPAPVLTDDEFIDQVLYPSVALFYRQDRMGNLIFTCTATAFERTASDTYRFLTAAHCVGDDNKDKDRVELDKVFFYIMTGTDAEKHYARAKVVAAGLQSKGEDFAVLEVKTKDKFPIMALGHDVTSRLGEEILNVSGPLGLGKQVFRGYVSSPLLDRPLVNEPASINWTGAVMLQIYGINGGSSGSAVVCKKQRAICAVLVGDIGGTTIVALPIDRFKKFYADSLSGNYPAFTAEDAAEQPKDAPKIKDEKKDKARKGFRKPSPTPQRG
jgi:S1-C subfamily serine protease